MAIITEKELKEKFKALELSDSTDFTDLIDSCYNYSMSAMMLSGAN